MSTTIPRVLHQIWIGGEPPEIFEKWAARWRALHPTWDYMLWTDCPSSYAVRELFDSAPALVPADRVGQFRSDVLRYEILSNVGGVYVDMDFEPRRSLEPVLSSIRSMRRVFAAWETEGKWIGNAILGAEPQTAFMQALVDGLPRSVADHAGKPPGVMTGPQYLTRTYRRGWLLEIFPAAMFYPYRFDELERAGEAFPDAVAVHRWANKAGLHSLT